MACTSPRTGWRLPSGKVSFDNSLSGGGGAITLPCGQCIGCRVSYSREWATRCLHEARYHDENYFLTLTYADNSFSLSRRDCQLFCKRLRKAFGPFRFYLAGEYGDSTLRPHYHVLAFGLQLAPFLERVDGMILCPKLEKIWGHGFVKIGDVNSTTADYTCKYLIKRLTGEAAKLAYVDREPEFSLMSRRPGIGSQFIKDYGAELALSGSTVIHGKERPLPKYYLSKISDEAKEVIKKRKRDFITAHPERTTYRHRRASNEIMKFSTNMKRSAL